MHLDCFGDTLHYGLPSDDSKGLGSGPGCLVFWDEDGEGRGDADLRFYGGFCLCYDDRLVLSGPAGRFLCVAESARRP